MAAFYFVLVLNFLFRDIKFHSFWITNLITVDDATLPLVQLLADIPEVEMISEQPEIGLLW